MSSYLLQPWTTVGGTSSVTTFTQDDEEWLPVDDFAEAAFIIDVSQVSGTSVSSPLPVFMYLETSPSRDESLFLPTCPPIWLAILSTTAPFATRTVRASVPGVGGITVPLAKWLRWRITALGLSSSWNATFRIRCRLLRETSFVPTDLSGCQLWLRGDIGVSLGTNGIQNWHDASGVGNDASQSTGGNQPSWSVSSPMNGCSAIVGNSTSSWMSTSPLDINITTNATLFAAVQPTTTSEGANHIRILETNYASNYYLGCDQAGTEYQFIVNYNTSPYGTAVTPANSIAKTTQLVTGWYRGGSPGIGTIYLNGQASGSDNTHFNSPGSTKYPLYIMSSTTGGSLLWSGYLGEVIIYNRALSTQELQRVHRYLGGRYAVAVP